MRKITLQSLVQLVKNNKWNQELNFQIKEITNGLGREWCKNRRYYKIIEQTHMWGYAQKISRCADITILYAESFFYTENQPQSLLTTSEGVDRVWALEGVIVVNDDVNEVPSNVWSRYLPLNFSQVDYSRLSVNSAINSKHPVNAS